MGSAKLDNYVVAHTGYGSSHNLFGRGNLILSFYCLVMTQQDCLVAFASSMARITRNDVLLVYFVSVIQS